MSFNGDWVSRFRSRGLPPSGTNRGLETATGSFYYAGFFRQDGFINHIKQP
jgi:hypothetical protein